MKKKWADPLDRLLEADEKARTVTDYLKSAIIENPSKNGNETISKFDKIVEIETNNIIRWEFKDRPENELGDILELAETFKSIGQQQPCILRYSSKEPGKYELIVGERRWRAAEAAKLKLKAIIHNLDDNTASLIQAVENEKRTDISEFAKGMSYSDKIEKGLLSQKDLTNILNISKQQVTRLLSYKKIPSLLFETIKDFRKVSSRTAYEISRLANKSEENLAFLIEMSEKIRDGKYGAATIEKELHKRLKNKEMVLASKKKIKGTDGRHLFTWRLDNNSSPSMHFPQDILDLIYENIINFEELTEEFKKCIEKKLSVLKN
jgi:ParB family chromosome partitioning protein